MISVDDKWNAWGGAGGGRKKGLTTANAEEKCDIEEGFTRDDDLIA